MGIKRGHEMHEKTVSGGFLDLCSGVERVKSILK